MGGEAENVRVRMGRKQSGIWVNDGEDWLL